MMNEYPDGGGKAWWRRNALMLEDVSVVEGCLGGGMAAWSSDILIVSNILVLKNRSGIEGLSGGKILWWLKISGQQSKLVIAGI